MSQAGYDRAAELHVLGVQLHNLGRPAAALRTLRRADVALSADPAADETARAHLAARIWISIALDEWEVHSAERGFAALDKAAALVEIADQPTLAVLLHCQRGLIELRGGDFARARTSLDKAEALLEHAQPREQASILLNRGTIALLEGRLAAARADLERAAAITRAAGLAIEEFKTLHNLGYLEFLAGDLPLALRLIDAAGEVDAPVSRGVWLLDRARVLTETGLAREADEALARAAAIFRRDRLGQDLAETELERARCALALGDVSAARRFARAALDRFRRRGGEAHRRAAELVLLQGDLAAGRPGRLLVAPALRLRAELAEQGLRLPARAATLVAAEALLAAGQVPAAVEALEEIGPARRSDPITGRMHSHYVRARLDAAQGQPRRAARRIGRALDELAAYQASFGSIDLRTAAAVHGRRLAELDLTLALGSGRPVAIFAAAERARAMASRLPAVRPPADPVAAELLAELRQNVEALRAVEQDRWESEPLLRRRRDLERRIVARSWTVAGAGGAVRPASLETVRARLAERDRTMVVYVQAGVRLSAVTVGARVRVHDLGDAAPVLERVLRVRADLDVLAQPHLIGPLRAAVRTSLARSLAALDAGLLRGVSEDGPLVIVSTGVLGRLPWASLPSLRGRPLAVAPSATKWLASTRPLQSCPASATRRASRGPDNPAGEVVAVAGPDLERAVEEVRGVADRWPAGTVLAGADATTGALAAAVASADVLHVAAHGVHQPENPLFSLLRMVDGPLFAHELDRVGRAPEHVVLSACEVGLATIRPGDEALGLASVLLQLGTRSVVAGVARVADVVAEQTMTAYHARLAAGADTASALAAALVELDSDVVAPFVNFGAAWSPV